MTRGLIAKFNIQHVSFLEIVTAAALKGHALSYALIEVAKERIGFNDEALYPDCLNAKRERNIDLSSEVFYISTELGLTDWVG